MTPKNKLQAKRKREKIKEDKYHKIYFSRNINLDHFYTLSRVDLSLKKIPELSSSTQGIETNKRREKLAWKKH